ncbi:unnamed protein product [Gulo gulo]|uniref:Uncharacterized protein n=1 Tax=Gulo gulo TaxID=48420 RepID=A0A9X9PVG4_GULGU|nr:unnamed protein product [Gulo gulo]
MPLLGILFFREIHSLVMATVLEFTECSNLPGPPGHNHLLLGSGILEEAAWWPAWQSQYPAPVLRGHHQASGGTRLIRAPLASSETWDRLQQAEAGGFFYIKITETPKGKLRKPHYASHIQAFLAPCNRVPCSKCKINSKQPIKKKKVR